MIVIDASSLAKYILREENWEKVKTYLLDEPYSLTLALAEVSNAIWKHHVLYRIISNDEAIIMFDALKKLGEDVLTLEPIEKYLGGAIRISLNEKIPVYDALYIVQAKKYNSLLTSDEKQYKIAKRLGITVEFID